MFSRHAVESAGAEKVHTQGDAQQTDGKQARPDGYIVKEKPVNGFVNNI